MEKLLRKLSESMMENQVVVYDTVDFLDDNAVESVGKIKRPKTINDFI